MIRQKNSLPSKLIVSCNFTGLAFAWAGFFVNNEIPSGMFSFFLEEYRGALAALSQVYQVLTTVGRDSFFHPLSLITTFQICLVFRNPCRHYFA